MVGPLNAVMFQAFHYFLPYDTAAPLWMFLLGEADHLRDIGIDAVWIPPPQKAFGGTSSVGYDAYDHFDLGEFDQHETTPTKYGSKNQLLAAIRSLHGAQGKRRIDVYVDVVLNQMFGGDQESSTWDAIRVSTDDRTQERWGPGYECGQIAVIPFTSFTYAGRGDRYSGFKWGARHFGSVDRVREIHQNGAVFNDPEDRYIYRFLHNEAGYLPADKKFADWVSLEKGNFDYLSGQDIDYGRYDVREEMKYWGAWLAETLGVDGFRLDAAKHFDAAYAREWMGHVRAATGRDLFCVAEYNQSDTAPLHAYLTEVTATGPYPQDVSLFDFPLRYRFRDASWYGEAFDLRDLDGSTLMAEQPAKAVTFVENHDTQYWRAVDSEVKEWFKPLAYAYILLRSAGYPCIFFADYYGLSAAVDHGRGQAPGREYLELLVKLRKQFALGDERYYAEKNVAGWVRMGGVPDARGALAVVINTAASGVRSILMDTGRIDRRFTHLATVKHTGQNDAGGFAVIRSAYLQYGDRAEGLWTGSDGRADFPADSGTVSLWLEDGVGLT